MILYGVNPVSEALSSQSSRVTRLYIAHGRRTGRIQKLIAEAREARVPIHFESPATLERKAKTANHQGVIAEMAAAVSEDLTSVLERQPDLILLVDGVEDPHNLGAVLRTAEAVGVGGVVLPKRHSCGISAAVVKASAGAALHLPVARVVNVARALDQCKEAGYWTVGLDMGGEQSVSQLDATLPLVLVVGGEDRGLRRLVKEKCDFLVALPLKGKVSSLNLSVAAGVVLYQILEIRESQQGESA